MDLTGARLRADVEDGDDLVIALRQYIADYKRSKDMLLRDEEFARISLYKKTVWTAWETSLASLREVEESHTLQLPRHYWTGRICKTRFFDWPVLGWRRHVTVWT